MKEAFANISVLPLLFQVRSSESVAYFSKLYFHERWCVLLLACCYRLLLFDNNNDIKVHSIPSLFSFWLSENNKFAKYAFSMYVCAFFLLVFYLFFFLLSSFCSYMHTISV